MRKRYHNMMEDMKGKIRVFARVRPVLKFEAQRGAKNALLIPDVLTVEHLWKEKKREYNFDSVFSPDTAQEAVGLSAAQQLLDSCNEKPYCMSVQTKRAVWSSEHNVEHGIFLKRSTITTAIL